MIRDQKVTASLMMQKSEQTKLKARTACLQACWYFLPRERNGCMEGDMGRLDMYSVLLAQAADQTPDCALRNGTRNRASLTHTKRTAKSILGKKKKSSAREELGQL